MTNRDLLMHQTMLQTRGHLYLTPIPNILTKLMPRFFRPTECLFVLCQAPYSPSATAWLGNCPPTLGTINPQLWSLNRVPSRMQVGSKFCIST